MRPSAVLAVNGIDHEIALETDRSLLHVLREELGLTGSKLACGEGVCGACTVLVDGRVTRACVTPVADAVGHAVTTIEGLAPAGSLHPLQQAFLDEAAFQCGFCTPGMIMAGAALLEIEPSPPVERVREALEGNICRCGTHLRILRAMQRTSEASPATAAPGARRVEDVPPSAGRPWDLSADHDALFAWLGDGLLVISEDYRAWLHVGASGTVTVASGKVDVGQGSASELAGVVVAELGATPASVHVLLADTDLAPYDAGTFGSRTTPDVVPAVSGVAAAARATLEAVAAAEWSVDLGSVNVAAGAVAGAGRSASFAGLVRGLRRVERAAPSAEPARAVSRVLDSTDIVTGRRRFTSDLSAPRMLHGRVLRPPAPEAELLSVDIGAAEAIDGVVVVREGDLVGVVAPDALTASRGLDALRPSWSSTSGPSSDDLESHLRVNPTTQKGWGGDVDESTGDADAALASAPTQRSATYTTAYIAHDPLETRAAVAHWDDDGRLTVWTGTQRPFGVREALAGTLGIGQERIRVVVPATGGAFGGKHTAEAGLEAARLARAVGQPVKVRWTREDEMAGAYARPAAVIDVRSGADADGTLLAWDFANLNSGPRAIEPPYRIANVHVRYQPAAGPLRQGSYRALSATANVFARESHIDEVAHAVGADPLELRLRQLDDDRLADVLRAAAHTAGWPRPSIGVACGIEKDSRVATVVEVQATLGEPLRIARIVTAFECGPIVDADNLRNQVEGAQLMALGGALFEKLELTDGRVTNLRQSEYRVPRFSDVPPIEVVLLDRPDVAPAGAGETPMITLAPAIANAIFAACGTRIRSLPLVPGGVIPPL
jgi:nicotinate dehydrogenase subunit B